MTAANETRINEWFVPKFGPIRFRVFVGLLFLPYTGMCISFTIIGSMLAGEIAWDRVGAIALIYALALGVSAHVADSLGSKKTKPWGSYFTRAQLLALMVATLAAAYAIGIYYIAFFVPLLAVIAALEGFFLFAYNFEAFGGRFHNNFWFAVSWGTLPALAGYVMQTDSINNILALAVSGLTGLVSYAEIRMSRPYKKLKQNGNNPEQAKKLENGLKIISLATIAFALALVAYRMIIFS
ncbi:MAG: hypothetical protein QXX64_05460 [Nitrososphaera sp.]|uniref:UbiA prenyltransferase n=1 Tax=Nitrososphaera gargensis (strain Ga9.2) TaxID=1237085 RepID=K0IKN5_NITGG|nr:hypothetical protein [Candidatus Nitrososphaera gargensis]AFU59062.1 hypothetical protein Ngar_c21310 [Candidatus Nitrososphaera gargensis Ga9.2]